MVKNENEKTTEELVRESEEKYRNLVNEMQSGLALHEIILDENGTPVDYRFLEVNPAFERLTGLKKESIIGRTVLEVLPKTEKLWIEIYGKVALTGESVEFENYASSLDRHYSVVAYRPQEKQFAVIIQEITERKRAEEKLEDNFALLRIAGEVAKLGGWNVNLEENRSYWSDVVAKIHEMPAGFAPMLEDGINFYAPEWREKITQVFTDCAKKGIPYNERMEIITATGKRIWIKTIGEAVRNEKGEIFKVHGAFQDITEEVEAETELKESEERYKALHNASFGGIVIHDKGLILECNQGLSDITGYFYDELIGMNGLLLIAEHAREKVIKNINDGYQLPYESVGVRKNGEEYPLRLHANNIPFKGKSVRSTEFRDITEQKKSEEEIKKTSRHYQALIEKAPDGIVLISNEGKFKYVSPAARRMFGFDEFEEITANPAMYTHPDDLQRVLDEISKTTNDPDYSPTIQYRFADKFGEWKWIESTYRNLFYDPSVEAIVINFRDITERKKAEQELRESETQYRNLANSGLALIWTSGTDKLCNYFNDTWLNFTGRTLEQELGNGWAEGVHPDDFDRCLETYVNAFDKREPFEMEYRLRHAGGEYRVILDLGNPNYNSNGEFIGYIGHCFDITERKKAEEEKEKLTRQLVQAQKMESIGRLAGGVAHDFNNMLSVIIGRTELALMKTGGDSQILNELTEIQNAAERSAALTKQLLAFARKQVISPKILGVNENIEKILALVKRLIGENIELKWTPEKKVWNIMIDPSQLDQIFTNLCVNSKDAMPDGGKITIVAENFVVSHEDENMPGLIPGDFVRISVEDNGHGMDKETASQIFEPFFTTKEIGKGTGLGLATVFGIVKQNKGYIYCFSTEGAGTRFEIYLPKKVGKNIEENLKKPICVKGEGSTTILLVEDEPTILEMSRSMLQMFGYTVISAESPQKALKLSLEHKGEIDLLITDVIMPEMNGRELSKKIISHHPEIKCLFMSGYTAEVIAYQGVLDEDMNFIQKPFTMKSLGEKVKIVIGVK